MKKMILIIVPILFLAGCAAKPVLLNKLHTPLKPEHFATKSKITMLSPEKKEILVADRTNQINELQQDYLTALRAANDHLDTLKQRADRRSFVNLGINLAGIAAGITAGVLLVASPANAVTAAAFTGFGTGVLSFQTQLIDEGYSRDSIGRIYQETINKITSAAEKYATHHEALVKGKASLEAPAWNEQLAGADDAIIKMNVATIFTSLPMGTSEDVDKLKKDNADLKKRLDDIEAKLNKHE